MSYPATFPNRAMPVPFRPSMGSKGTGDAMGRAAGTRAGRPGRSGAHTCPAESRGAAPRHHLGPRLRPTRAPRAGRVAGLQAPAAFLSPSSLPQASRPVRAAAAAAATPGFYRHSIIQISKSFSVWPLWLGRLPDTRSPNPRNPNPNPKKPNPKNPNTTSGSKSRYPKLFRVNRV